MVGKIGKEEENERGEVKEEEGKGGAREVYPGIHKWLFFCLRWLWGSFPLV